jgi:phage protein D
MPLGVINTTPTLQILGQGVDLATSLLIGMEMSEEVGGMSALELRFSNMNSKQNGSADFAFEDGRVLSHGLSISVYAGSDLTPREIFRGKVSALDARFPENAPPELHVLAEDDLQQARLTRKTAVFTNKSPADIIRQIGQGLSLEVKVTGLDQPVATQVQLNETDLGFLRRLLARYDGDMQVVGKQLQVSPRSEVKRNEVTLHLNYELTSVRLLADLAHQVTSVTASGWDVKNGKAISVSSSGNGPSMPGSGTPGSGVLSNAFGDREEHVAHLALKDEKEAQAIADAVFTARARRFVVAKGVCVGNPEIRVGTFVTLGGLGPRFSNTYYVTRSRHRFNTVIGYQTEFEAECGMLGGNG